MSKHTPGQLSVSFGTKWPFEILIINESGSVVYRDTLPCYSSKDKTFEEALNCWNFKASEQEEYAAINKRVVADAYLRAAAPDLLEALQVMVRDYTEAHADSGSLEMQPALLQASRAIARATGEHP